MKLSTPCKKLFRLDISEIKKLSNKITSEEWDQWNYRQKKYRVHSQTKSYPLVFWDEFYQIESNKPCKIGLYNRDSPLWGPVNNVKKELESYYNGECVNIIFTLMPPKSYIPIHTDNGILLSSCHRCHIPIKTNKEVLFFVAGEIYNLEEGFCYEFSNLDLHCVENNSDKSRIHLIMDIMSKDINIPVQFDY